jgi:hypothetical protein
MLRKAIIKEAKVADPQQYLEPIWQNSLAALQIEPISGLAWLMADV